jgi:hypothetical protein
MRARHRAIVLAIAGLVLVAPPAAAQRHDYGTMYDDRLLEQKQGDYREVVQWNLQNVFLPKLTPAERQRLRSLSLEFPLRGPDRGPFEYFAQRSGRVVLPVMSIRFLADVSVAFAWLDTNGYTMEPVTDYVSMVKYQSQAKFGGRYPDLRAALRIPAAATDNTRVDNLSQQILNQSLSFLLLHEMGHVLYQHPGYGPDVPFAQARQNEDEADRFALEVLRRVGQPVSGLLFFFLAAAHFVPHRADFGSDADYQAALARDTHPLTSDRVRRLAQYLREHAADYGRLQDNPARAAATIRGIADAIDQQVVPVLADPDQQRLMALRGRSMTLAGLAPRRPGETMAAPPPSAGAPGPLFHGVFDGQIDDGTGVLSARAVLFRQGERVTGQYSFGAGQGQISGLVEGDTLTFLWRTAEGAGRGVLRSSRDGSKVEGTWGHGDRTSGGGRWSGTRGR